MKKQLLSDLISIINNLNSYPLIAIHNLISKFLFNPFNSFLNPFNSEINFIKDIYSIFSEKIYIPHARS